MLLLAAQQILIYTVFSSCKVSQVAHFFIMIIYDFLYLQEE